MIGIDIVSIKRFEKFLNRFNKKALERYLNKDEISLVKNSYTAAGFFAAKEAISKALGVGISKDCSFFDIVINKDNRGAPYFTLSEDIIKKYKITDCSLSITHDEHFAIAVADIRSAEIRKKSICHQSTQS